MFSFVQFILVHVLVMDNLVIYLNNMDSSQNTSAY